MLCGGEVGMMDCEPTTNAAITQLPLLLEAPAIASSRATLQLGIMKPRPFCHSLKVTQLPQPTLTLQIDLLLAYVIRRHHIDELRVTVN